MLCHIIYSSGEFCRIVSTEHQAAWLFLHLCSSLKSTLLCIFTDILFGLQVHRALVILEPVETDVDSLKALLSHDRGGNGGFVVAYQDLFCLFSSWHVSRALV